MLFVSQILDEASHVEEFFPPRPDKNDELNEPFAGPLSSDLRKLYTVMRRYEIKLEKATRRKVLEAAQRPDFLIEDIRQDSPEEAVARAEFNLVYELLWAEVRFAFPIIADHGRYHTVTITPDWMLTSVDGD